MMSDYVLTVFEKSGEKLLDETIQASNDAEGKILAEQMLKEKGYEEYTHRFVAPNARLVLFHR